MRLSRPLEKLVDELIKLPSIGPKTAQRLALYILKLPREEVFQLSEAIINARDNVFPCPSCGLLTDTDPCYICSDDKRDRTLLCVTEETSDVIAFERTGYRGTYFVLNKDFHLMGNDSLEDLNMKPFNKKLSGGNIIEVVLALNPDIDGEIMSRYIASIAEKYNVKVTRLAHGIPVGGNIEFADEITLRKAFEGRKEI